MEEWKNHIDEQLDSLFYISTIFHVDLYTKIGDEYPFIFEIQVDDWDFFWQITILYTAYHGAFTIINEEQQKYLQMKFSERLDSESQENKDFENAMQDLHNLILKNAERAKNDKEEEQKRMIEFTLGFWIVSNSLNLNPFPDEYAQGTHVIGKIIYGEFASWFSIE